MDMTEYQKERNTDSDKTPYVRTAIGLLVLTIGIVLAFSIVQEAYRIIHGEGTYGILESTFSADEVERTFKTATHDIQLPQSFYTIIGYLMITLLLSICARIAVAIVSSGAKIIRPDYDEILKRLKKIEKES